MWCTGLCLRYDICLCPNSVLMLNNFVIMLRNLLYLAAHLTSLLRHRSSPLAYWLPVLIHLVSVTTCWWLAPAAWRHPCPICCNTNVCSAEFSPSLYTWLCWCSDIIYDTKYRIFHTAVNHLHLWQSGYTHGTFRPNLGMCVLNVNEHETVLSYFFAVCRVLLVLIQITHRFHLAVDELMKFYSMCSFRIRDTKG